MELDKIPFKSFEAFCNGYGYNFLDYLYYAGKNHGRDYVDLYMGNQSKASDIYRTFTQQSQLKEFVLTYVNRAVMDKPQYDHWKKISNHWVLYLEIVGHRKSPWDRLKLNPIEMFEIDVIAQEPNNTSVNMGQASGFDESML